MPSLDKIKDVITKIISVDGVAKHVAFFGGAVPYIRANKDSGREHSDIDVLVDEEYMDKLREMAKEKCHYMPEQDSVVMGLDRDYGFKVFIGDVYVEFEPISVKDGVFTHRSFSYSSKKAGEQHIPFEQIEDILVPVEINGIQTRVESNEMIRASKAECARPKDIADVEFIDSCGIDEEKYARVQNSLLSREMNVFPYQTSQQQEEKTPEL